MAWLPSNVDDNLRREGTTLSAASSDPPDPVRPTLDGADCSLGLPYPRTRLAAPNVRLRTNIRVGLELAISMLDESSDAHTLADLEGAAARWARQGLAIDTVQHALHEGVRIGLGLLEATRDAAGLGDPIAGAAFLIDLLDSLTTAVSRAYIAETHVMFGEGNPLD